MAGFNSRCIRPTLRTIAFALSIVISGCEPSAPAVEPATDVEEPAFASGAEVWMRNDFGALKGASIGLLVNHTARVDSSHLSDIVSDSSAITLKALFGPEHGIRGDADAGEEVDDGLDQRTGVPVYSLYGETRKPTPASLEGLDALVYDIQDVGARFYTYMSTMGLAMQAAAEAGIPFVVLDRPNPLGGEYVSGYVLEAGYESFVGAYPVPVAYGLTIGELANMMKGEAWLDGLESLDLRVIQMEGWNRSERWPSLNMPWRPTSPNIPKFDTALAYPGMCFFEAVEANEGRGTYNPFLQVGAPWADENALASRLNAFGLPGVRFSPIQYTPESIEGMSSSPRFKDELMHGISLTITQVEEFDPVSTGIHAIWAFYDQAPEGEKADFLRERWMGSLAGTGRLYEQLKAGMEPGSIVASWKEEVDTFRQKRAAYLLY